MPLVSIIVPNYNHAAYLNERLKSIKAQDFSDYELIILDDASNDESPELIEAFRKEHPECRVYYNEQNSGSPFVQWNKGVELADGKYLWIAESDDFCAPHFLSTLVPMLESDREIGIAYGQSWLVDENGEKMYSYLENLSFIYKSNAWEKDFVIDGAEACRKWVLHHNPIPNASGALMRKEAFEEAGRAEPSMRLNGDWHLYAKILCRYKLAFTAQHLNYFRVHAQTQRSASRKRASVYTELVAINNLIRKAIPDAESEANEALSEFGNWWMGNLPYHSINAENWRLNRKLYKIFSAVKTNLPWRIFLTFLITYLRDFLNYLGLLKILKKWRSALFPGKYWDK
jgi:glycosyltransferase involved in cell wall biosynthesis